MQVNALVNKVQGKGFEDERNYTNMRFQVGEGVQSLWAGRGGEVGKVPYSDRCFLVLRHREHTRDARVAGEARRRFGNSFRFPFPR